MKAISASVTCHRRMAITSFQLKQTYVHFKSTIDILDHKSASSRCRPTLFLRTKVSYFTNLSTTKNDRPDRNDERSSGRKDTQWLREKDNESSSRKEMKDLKGNFRFDATKSKRPFHKKHDLQKNLKKPQQPTIDSIKKVEHESTNVDIENKSREQNLGACGNLPPREMTVLVSCLPGLESILSQELTALKLNHEVMSCGAKMNLSSSKETNVISKTNPRSTVGMAESCSDILMKCHLFLGSATNILIQCGNPFKARGLAELRRKTSLLPWKDILDDQTTTISLSNSRVVASKSKLYHTGAILERIVSGIYDALGRTSEESSTPSTEEISNQSTIGTKHDVPSEWDTSVRGDGTSIPLDIRVVRDEVFISLNTSSTPLHNRGYRRETAKAPLRADLAFALLQCAGWHPLYYDNIPRNDHIKSSVLLDPFCGSGTIAIEAATMAAGLPPGRLRPPPLAGTRIYNPMGWAKLVEDACRHPSTPKTNSDKANYPVVSASDRDKGAVSATKENARRAGVLAMMDVQCTAFSGHPLLSAVMATTADEQVENPKNDRRLLVVSNLPFGKRLSPSPRSKHHDDSASPSASDPFLNLYQTLGHRINKLLESGQHVEAMFLGNDPKLIRRIALKGGFKTKFKSVHGGINVFALFAPKPD